MADLPLLAPIVDSVDIRPIVTRFVGSLHHNTLYLGTKATGHHTTIGLVATGIDPGDEA